MMSIEGYPAFLRAETTDDNTLIIPPFIEVIKDVTEIPSLTSKNMALKNFVFNSDVIISATPSIKE